MELETYLAQLAVDNPWAAAAPRMAGMVGAMMTETTRLPGGRFRMSARMRLPSGDTLVWHAEADRWEDCRDRLLFQIGEVDRAMMQEAPAC